MTVKSSKNKKKKRKGRQWADVVTDEWRVVAQRRQQWFEMQQIETDHQDIDQTGPHPLRRIGRQQKRAQCQHHQHWNQSNQSSLDQYW